MLSKSTGDLHAVLHRQLKKSGASLETPPDQDEWRLLVKRINQTYLQAEQDRYLLERSLDISSHEMEELYERLKQTSASEIAAAHEKLKEVNEELRIARDHAIQSNHAKSDFLAHMSHELRTPLNAIIGYSEMLVEDHKIMSQEEMLNDLKKLRASANHLLSLINDVLDLSKIEAGKFELMIETFEVSTHIRDFMTVLNPILEKNQNQFVLRLHPQLGSITTDPLRLRQILINLLSNASKFTRQGTITLHVERLQEESLHWIQYSVEDTGIGIKPEQLALLFSPFTQATKETFQQYGGTGLGLTISKQFCELMGGRLEATSQPDQGSTFRIILPTTQAI